MEIPAVVSDTGSGSEVVNHGVTGFVVRNATDKWVAALGDLLGDRCKAANMGRAARLYVASRYSTASQRSSYIKVFKGEP